MKSLRYIKIDLSSEKNVRWIGVIFIAFSIISFIYSLLDFYRFRVITSERFIGLVILAVTLMMFGVAILVFAAQIISCISTRCTTEALMSGLSLSFCVGLTVLSLIFGCIQCTIAFAILSLAVAMFVLYRQKKKGTDYYQNVEAFTADISMDVPPDDGNRTPKVDDASVIDSQGSTDQRVPLFTVEE